MDRLVILDAGPLGIGSKSPSRPDAARCLAWMRALAAAGTDVVVPEIADYEVRRELIRARKTGGLRRLDELGEYLTYLPITTPALRRAAEFWAIVRNLGLPTAHPDSLDADAILAGQAAVAGLPGDEVIVATTNLGHLREISGHRRPAMGHDSGRLTGASAPATLPASSTTPAVTARRGAAESASGRPGGR